MKFNFEKFLDVDESFAARVTIRQKTGQIGFNTGSINRFKITSYDYVVLFFDSGQRVVGLSLESERVAGAIEIKKSKGNTYVRAKNFLDKYGVDYTESHRYELKRDEDSELLFFCLDEASDDEEEEDEDGKGLNGPKAKDTLDLLDGF